MMRQLETRSKNKKVFKLFVVLILILALKVPFGWFLSIFYTPAFSASDLVENYILQAKDLVFKSKSELIEDNRTLAQNNAELSIELASAKKVFLENLELKRELSLSEKKDFITARIVSSANSSLYGSLLVYSDLDLNLGSKVYIGDKILIGFIEQKVGDLYKVKLASSYKFQRDGVIKPSNIPVLVQGGGIGRYFINVSREVDIYIGDVVEDTFGNLLGYVQEVEYDTTNPYKEVFFNIPYNLFQATFVNIEK